MTNALLQKNITCPYCWQTFEINIEPSLEAHECYIEDCYVCCRPIEITIVSMDEEDVVVRINRVEGNEF